jgi:hypothetical protein
MKSNTEKTLVLSKDVWNPKSDLRYKRDWRKRELFEKGTKFLIISEFYERDDERELLADYELEIASHREKAGEEPSVGRLIMMEILKEKIASGPREIVLIQIRSTKHRYLDRASKHGDPELFDALMEALQETPKDLKDVLGEYSSPDWGGGPAAVIQQLVDNGTITFGQVERAVAELDPDHTVLDSIVMATADEGGAPNDCDRA